MNAVTIALDAIWSHRLRSALTTLGVVIGVLAVVTLTSLGSSVSSYVSGQFKTFGATLIAVTPAVPSQARPASTSGSTVPSTFTVADADAISHLHSAAIRRVAPLAAQLPVPVAATPHGASGISVQGVTPSFFGAVGLAFAHGRFRSGGAVLGRNAAAILFPRVKNVVGHTLYIAGRPVTVTGVLAPVNNLLNKGNSTTVFIALGQALRVSHLSYITEIVVQASAPAEVHRAVAAVRAVMNQRHPLHNFAIATEQQYVNTIDKTLSTITTFLAGIAAIALVVGGIGIMNIMLVTVTERFREIGIRKAVGAQDSDILVQFLVEAVLLAVLGGALGALLATIVTGLIAQLAGFPGGVTASAVILAIAFSTGVGVVFGVLPAVRAARLMPAEALRAQ